ncbi:MAG: transposase [Anaerolineae bacterium]
MPASRKRYADHFKRQAVARMTDDPAQTAALAIELGVPRGCLYDWRKRYASPLP